MDIVHRTLVVPGAKLWIKERGEGPLLLIIQGGAADADMADALAVRLVSRFRVVTYDRRGISRSPLDDPKHITTILEHAEDALRLLEELDAGPALVLGSSLGAAIALELVTRAPEAVRLLVAHEPPLVRLLSAEEQERHKELRAELSRIALSEGTHVALKRLLAESGVNREDREDDIDPPPSSRERRRGAEFSFAREAHMLGQMQLDLGALRAQAQRIVPAHGSSSRECFPARCALALARAIEREPAEFPGGHTGYTLRPTGFASVLTNILLSQAHAAGAA